MVQQFMNQLLNILIMKFQNMVMDNSSLHILLQFIMVLINHILNHMIMLTLEYLIKINTIFLLYQN